MRRHGGREGMRRPRAGFASLPPGGPGQPSAPTTRGRLHWAGRGADEGGRKPAGSGARLGPRPRPEATAPGTEKPRWSAERRPRSSHEGRGKTEDWCATRCSIPSPFGGERKREDGVPGAAQITRAHKRTLLEYGRRSVGCLKFESDAFGRRTTLGVMPGLDPGIHDETPRIEGLRKFADAALPHGLPG